jgi:glycosyltransferase involved in cell wall biosynthesis
MDKDILVSICCITYNHAPFICQCLDGFMMQKTDFPFEVLVHDDASTDGTVDIIREYESKYPDIIKPIYQAENQYSKKIGISVTYQYPRAKGKYIALCEGDDYWTDPLKLQRQVDFLEANEDFSLVFSNRNVLQKTGILTVHIHENRVYTCNDILKGFIPPTQTMVFRNQTGILLFFQKIGRFYSGDRMLAYICSIFGNIGMIPDITAVYRDSGYGVWSSKTQIEKIKTHSRMFQKFHEIIGLPKNNEYCAERQLKCFCVMLKYCIKYPTYFFKDHNLRFLYEICHNNNKMNRSKIIWGIIRRKCKK